MGCMTESKSRDLSRLVDSFQKLADAGRISGDLAFFAGQIATLAFVQRDEKAMILSCVLARFLREVEAGTDFEWAFSMVTGPEAVARLRVVK